MTRQVYFKYLWGIACARGHGHDVLLSNLFNQNALHMQPVHRNLSPQVTHYQEVNFTQLIDSAKEREFRAICRYAEKLPPPMLED